MTLVLRRAGLPIATGTLIGLAGSAVATGLLRSVVAASASRATCPVMAAVAGLLLLAGLTAALQPALRATRIDPRTSLSVS